MPPRNAPQNVVKQDNAGEHGRARAICEAEVRPQVLRLMSTEMGTQKQLIGEKPFIPDASPRDVEENTDFYSLEPNKQFSGTSRISEDVAHAIVSRHQRSKSVGSNNTCYVVQDAEGKPVLRLITNGLAISRKFGAATVFHEPSQSSVNSSRNVSKEMSTVVNKEEIVLMLGDSVKSSRPWAKPGHIEQQNVHRKSEQTQPGQKMEKYARRRRQKRTPKQEYSSDNQDVEAEMRSGRRRREKRVPRHEYSSDTQEVERDLGSLRRHSRRERRYSKDSFDSFEEIERPRLHRRPLVTDFHEYRADRNYGHQQNKHGSRSQTHALKSQEFFEHRRSKNRSARIDGGKESSAQTSFEETTQEPHSSASVEFMRASGVYEDALTGEEDDESAGETEATDKEPDSKKSGSAKSSGKEKSKSTGTTTSGSSKKKSISKGSEASNNKKKGKGTASEKGKDKRKGSVKGKRKSSGTISRKGSQSGASSASEKSGGRKRSASSTPSMGKRKSSASAKGAKGKARKDSKRKSVDKKRRASKKSSKDAGLVQGLQIEEATPPVEETPLDASLFETPIESPQIEETEPPTAEPSPEPYEPPREEEQTPAEEPESESLGTIIYQHVARYICIGLLRVAGGVRVIFDVVEKQAYIQIISPLCEVYVTYYANNMTFLTSTSAAGVAWAAAVYRKKDSGQGKEQEKDANSTPAKRMNDHYTHEDLQARLEKCRFPEASKSMIDTAHVVFCDPYQAQRFKTVLETLKSAMECTNTLITPCIPSNNYFGCSAVPSTIVDPTVVNCPCPPPMAPPCCSVPYSSPCCNTQYQQNPCQCMPFGVNPCLGAEPRPFQNYCCQPSMFPCPNNFMTQRPFLSQGQQPNQQESNLPTITPSPAPAAYNTPGYWSQFSSPHSSLFATPNPTLANLQTENEMSSEPQTPVQYPQYSDQGDSRGRIRFNPNVTVFQQESQTGSQNAMNRSNGCASMLQNFAQQDCYDPYSYENCFGKTLFCAPACLVRLNNEMAWTDLHKGCVKIYQCPNNGGYSLVLENTEKAITTHHYLTADTIFLPSEKTQFGFTYTTVTRSENRGTFVDHYLVSFMNCRSAEQFKCVVDSITMLLKNTSDDWSGAPCPSKSIRNWQGYVVTLLKSYTRISRNTPPDHNKDTDVYDHSITCDGVQMLAALDTADCRQKKPGLFSLDETFFMPQFMEQKYENRIIKQKHRTDDSVSPWTEATAYPKANIGSCVLQNVSWTYVIVYNPRRIPDTTLEAVCSTQQCLAPHLKNYTAITEPSLDDVERSQSPYSSTLPSKTLCREVRYFRWVKVKSRRIFQKKVKLTRMLLPVTVACSCITVNNLS